MMHPQLQLSQPGLIQGGAAGMANPDVFRRIIQAQLNAKDGSQVSIFSKQLHTSYYILFVKFSTQTTVLTLVFS
jgi:hypothetical protein